MSLADYLTIVGPDLPPTGYEHYEQWIVMCPDDQAGEWFIYGSADGIFDEVQGPFRRKSGALHMVRHVLQKICPRAVSVI